MTCEEFERVREQVSPLEAGEEVWAGVRAHFRDCATCRGRMEERAAAARAKLDPAEVQLIEMIGRYCEGRGSC